MRAVKSCDRDEVDREGRNRSGRASEAEAALLEERCREHGHPPSCLVDGECVCGLNRYD